MTEPLLELQDVDAAYGAFRALFGVSFSVEPGGVTAVLGPNGAGKTTVARVCSGLVRPAGGRLLVEGDDVTGEAAWRIARRGIAHVPEGRSIFSSLSVEENLRLHFRAQMSATEVEPTLGRAYEAFPRLGERQRQLAGTLSGGEQRMLALARVLAQPPRLLIADELSLGLAPIIVDDVYRALAQVRDQGSALLVIEQHVRRALELADDVVLLSKGRVVHAGPKSELGDQVEELLPDAATVD